MKKLLEVIWREPVVILAIAVGVTTLLANEGLIAEWIPLVALAVAAGYQRASVEPVKEPKDNGSV